MYIYIDIFIYIYIFAEGKFTVPMALKVAKQDELTHRGRVTHICVCKIDIIDADNGLSPGRRQAIIWTHAVN